MILVLFEYLQWIFKQGYIELHIGLLTLLAYPLAPVCIFGDILGAKVVDIDVRQPRVTTEQEYISHHFESLNRKFLFSKAIYLGHSQILSYDLLLGILYAGKRIDGHPTVGKGEINDPRLENFQNSNILF